LCSGFCASSDDISSEKQLYKPGKKINVIKDKK